MKIELKHILITALVLILLIAANVYQWNNPQVVEVPAEQTKIDKGAWVQKSAYQTRAAIIDSLRAQNEKLADRIEDTGDKIANYTSIIGNLRLQLDSVKNESATNAIDLTSLLVQRDSTQFADTTFTRTEIFGDNFLSVTATAKIQNNTMSLDIQQPQQLRPLRIDVANTTNESRTRNLLYVQSPDLDSVQVRSVTGLEPKKELPKFWIGAGIGVAGTLTGFILLK
ncbi:hypothetical protein LX73_2344 [Fodinibius salinus]|uniref:Uncharacterized protein n=1 Tax=Fodinibius salinus TaxID=860790 RepID=A0A5D3YFA5_9BACT|nr:hypothetical protein [Fodinibius salinus]TYP92096.1 hypothetical protein LX73_2344 [Fodinibius salinus]